MISDDISFDKLLADIDQQIEILTAIAGDNAILTEQLRLLNESRDLLLFQDAELERLEELLDPDENQERFAIIDRIADDI